MKKTLIVLAALCLLITAVMGAMAVSAAGDAVYGDLTGDGKVNNKDLGRLQQYLSDWDVTLGPDEPVVPDDNIYNDTELEWD